MKNNKEITVGYWSTNAQAMAIVDKATDIILED